jgi:hypothetical protein
VTEPDQEVKDREPEEDREEEILIQVQEDLREESDPEGNVYVLPAELLKYMNLVYPVQK